MATQAHAKEEAASKPLHFGRSGLLEHHLTGENEGKNKYFTYNYCLSPHHHHFSNL